MRLNTLSSFLKAAVVGLSGVGAYLGRGSLSGGVEARENEGQQSNLPSQSIDLTNIGDSNDFNKNTFQTSDLQITNLLAETDFQANSLDSHLDIAVPSKMNNDLFVDFFDDSKDIFQQTKASIFTNEKWLPVKKGTEFRVNTYTSIDQCSPSIAGIDGGFVVVWDSKGPDGSEYGIYGRRYDTEGVAQGTEFQVNTYISDNQWTPSVSGIEGGFVVVWERAGQDGNAYGIYGQRYNTEGVAQGTEFQVNTYISDWLGGPSVAGIKGGFVVVWQVHIKEYSTKIYGQRYDTEGVPQGLEFQVNTDVSYFPESPCVTGIDGGFVVVWLNKNLVEDYCGVYGQRYDKDGIAQGSEFQVSTYNNQIYPSVASIKGGFVVVWTSDDLDISKYGVNGQRYDTDGVAQGSEFQVNTYISDYQWMPSVVGAKGGFVVVWQSYDQDGSSWGIYGQKYDTDGVAQGSEFQVNTYTYSAQMYPSIASIKEGFVVVWERAGLDGSGDGIYGQRYSLDLEHTMSFRFGVIITSVLGSAVLVGIIAHIRKKVRGPKKTKTTKEGYQKFFEEPGNDISKIEEEAEDFEEKSGPLL